MIFRQILFVWTITCVLAQAPRGNAAPAADEGGGLTNLPPALKKLILSSDEGVKVSGAPNDTRTNAVSSHDSAAIYSAWLVPSLRDKLLALDPGLKISEQTNQNSKSVICAWPEVSVRLTVQSHWDGSQQRPAMKNWIAGLPGADTNAAAFGTLASQIDGTVACIGSVITPHYDSAGKAAGLVLGLAGELNGYVYSQGAFYAPTGERIVGLTNAPEKFNIRR
jgi:hypothetical protein